MNNIAKVQLCSPKLRYWIVQHEKCVRDVWGRKFSLVFRVTTRVVATVTCRERTENEISGKCCRITNVTSDSAAFNSHERFRKLQNSYRRIEKEITGKPLRVLLYYDPSITMLRERDAFAQMQFESIIHDHHRLTVETDHKVTASFASREYVLEVHEVRITPGERRNKCLYIRRTPGE